MMLCFGSDICSMILYSMFITASVEHPWERAISSNKVPYYIKYVYLVVLLTIEYIDFICD